MGSGDELWLLDIDLGLSGRAVLNSKVVFPSALEGLMPNIRGE